MLFPDSDSTLDAQISDKVESFLNNIYEAKDSEPPRFDLRVSSFPFCTMLKLTEFLNYQTAKNNAKEVDYAFKYYVSIGTSVHSALQLFATLSDQRKAVSAKWPYSCDHKGKTPEQYAKFISELPALPMPNELKKCEKYPKCGCFSQGVQHYEELDFLYEGVLSGHLDMLLRFGNKEELRYVALEFKTTGDNSVVTGNYLPQEKHKVQIETYCLMLRLLYNIRVSHYVIIYFSRDKPGKVETDSWLARRKTPAHRSFVVKVTTEMLKPHLVQVKRAVKSFRAAQKLLALLTPETYDKELVQKYLDLIAKYRPCQTQEDYDSYTKKAFFSKEQCQFCTSSCIDGQSTTAPLNSLKRQIKAKLSKLRDQQSSSTTTPKPQRTKPTSPVKTEKKPK